MFVNISKISNQVSEMIVSELTNYEDGKESRLVNSLRSIREWNY